MTSTNFDFKQIDLLPIDEQKKYLTKYFIPLSNGSHCMYKDGSYEMITDEVINKFIYDDVVRN